MNCRIAIAILVPLIFCAAASTQTAQTAPASPSTPQTVRLRKGMLLKLETVEALDPATARAGDDVPLRFKRALYVEGITIIPAGTLVHSTVVKVTPAGRHCATGEVVWNLSSITLPDSSVVRTHVRYTAAPGGDVYVPESIQDKASQETSAGDRVGKGIETTLAVPFIAVALPIEGVKSLLRKPVHGCAIYTHHRPLRAHSSVAVEIREDHDVHF